MELAVRQFARRVLLIHVVLLAAVLAIVLVASRGVYQSARDHAMTQAQRRQQLLAQETARAVQSYYDSILSDMIVLKPVNPDDPDSEYVSAIHSAMPTTQSLTPVQRAAAGFVGPLILNRQLDGRVSHLFTIDRNSHVRWVGIGARETAPSAAEIAQRIAPWLKTIKVPTMSDYMLFGDRGYHFVALPSVGTAHENYLIAAVPAQKIEQWFLNELDDKTGSASTFLVNDQLQILATGKTALNGKNLAAVGSDSLSGAITNLAGQEFRGTEIVSGGFSIGNVHFGPSLVTTSPIRVGEHHWFVLLTWPVAEVDAIVQQFFSRALFWAIFLVVSMTAILVSTATQLIRNRARIEKFRHSLLDKELAEARRIQLAWLPQGRPADGALDVATANEPATSISGDFYNWFDLPDGRTAVAIGDVTGHGMSAAFLMATTQLLVRTTLPGYCDAAACLQQVNHQLCVQAFNGQFVTMVLMILDPRTGRVEFASAGHPLPLKISANVASALVGEPDLVLGVEANSKYHNQTLSLRPGDCLLLYTDGVIECENKSGERFGLQRLVSAAQSVQGAQPSIDAISAALGKWRSGGTRADDVTLVAIRLFDDKQPTRRG